jgi:hypothetical protein
MFDQLAWTGVIGHPEAGMLGRPGFGRLGGVAGPVVHDEVGLPGWVDGGRVR